MSKRTIERSIEIAAPLAQVWQALTNAEDLGRWFPLSAEVKPGAGGEVNWIWGDMYKWCSQIKVWEEEKHLQLHYRHSGEFITVPDDQADTLITEGSGELVMDFQLEARGGKTVLRLVHSGFGNGANWDQEYDGTSRGWSIELLHLKHYLENHWGQDRCVAWIIGQLDGSAQDDWDKLMSGDGLLSEGTLAGLQSGDQYKITTAAGDSFSGRIDMVRAPLDFIATVENLNNGILRVWIEDFYRTVNLWLTTYGVAQSVTDDFKKEWSERLPALLQT